MNGEVIVLKQALNILGELLAERDKFVAQKLDNYPVATANEYVDYAIGKALGYEMPMEGRNEG